MAEHQWDYLATEVLTSPPQKLQLLLLEGALRHIHRTESCWQAGQVEEGYQSLEKARAIVGELLAGVRPERWPEVAPRVAAVYRFVYLLLAEVGLTQSVERLRQAARILEVDRDTWRQVCQQLQGKPPEATAEPPEADRAASTVLPSVDQPTSVDINRGAARGFDADAFRGSHLAPELKKQPAHRHTSFTGGATPSRFSAEV